MKFVLESTETECHLQPVSVIGTGAYGTVFKALMTPTSDVASPASAHSGRIATTSSTSSSVAAGGGSSSQPTTVAVKQICFDDVPDEVADLMKELRVLSVAQHPNIPRYLGSVLSFPNLTSPQTTGAASTPTTAVEPKVVGGGSPKKGTATNNNMDKTDALRNGIRFSTLPSMCIVQEFIEGGTLAEYYSGGVVTSPSACGGGVAGLLAHKNNRAALRTSPQQQSLAGLEAATSHAPSIPPITQEEVGTVVMDVLKALVHLHEECRIVHRDVKCSNLLLSVRDGRVKLCDFGTSVAMPSAAEQRTTMIGTPGWMAPEVWNSGGTHSFASDIWSLGVAVLEMTMLTTVQTDPLFNQYVQTISLMPCSMQEGPQPSNSRTSTFSALNELRSHPEMLDFVACCLRRNPLQRPSARKLLESHPLVTMHALVHNPARKTGLIKAMADFVLAVKRRVGGHVDPFPAASHNTRNTSVSPSDMQADGYGACYGANNSAATNAASSWKLPAQVASLVSSEPFRLVPNTLYSAPSAPTESKSNNAAAASYPFGQIIVPATAQTRIAIRRVFGVYRGMSDCAVPPAHDEASHNQPGAHDDAYTLAELQGNQVTFDAHERMLDQVLSSFHRADTALSPEAAKVCAGASFTSLFLDSFLSTMMTNEDDVEDLKGIVEQHTQLQRDPLRHLHRSKSQATQQQPAALSSPHSPTTRSRPQQPTVPPLASSHSSSPVGGAGAAMNFTMQDWIKAPPIPLAQSSSSPAMSGGSSNNASVDIAALLYNRWLADYKRTIFQSK